MRKPSISLKGRGRTPSGRLRASIRSDVEDRGSARDDPFKINHPLVGEKQRRMTAEDGEVYLNSLDERLKTTLTDWLASARNRITVFEAIEIVTGAARFPGGGVDLFVKVVLDESGNQVEDLESAPDLVLNDGRNSARKRVAAAFLAFCKTEDVKPRDPVLLWASPVFVNPHAQGEFEITAVEFQRFAAGYELDVSRSPTTPIAGKIIPKPAVSKTAVEGLGGLTTDDICEAFDGVGMNSLEWRTAITKNRPRWLMACLARQGKRGGEAMQAQWYPLLLAKAIAGGASTKTGVVPAALLDAAFRRGKLRPWLEEWIQLRADNSAWG